MPRRGRCARRARGPVQPGWPTGRRVQCLLLQRPRPRPLKCLRYSPSMGVSAMIDSFEATSRRGDRTGALQWATWAQAIEPRLTQVNIVLSKAQHNFALAQRRRLGRPRPGLRTSLDRAVYELRAFASADTAMAVARDDAERSDALEWRGNLYETIGLPLDAYVHYAIAAQIDPRFEMAARRAYWVSEHLRDPLLPDRLAVPRRR